MTDIAPVDPVAPIAPPSGYSGEPPAAAPPPEAPAHEADPMVDPFEYGQQNFPRAYVEQLRNEAAQRRVAAREAEEALAPFQAGFAGLTDEDVATVLQFTRTLAVDPDAAAEWMVSTGQMIRDQRAQAEAAISGQFIDDDSALNPQQYDPNDPRRPWTVADQQRWEAEQAYRAQTSQLINHWNREADRLGYNPQATPNDPGGPAQWLQFQQLVKMAEYTGGNLEAAHNILVQQSQGAVNQQLQQRVETVRGMTRSAPPAAAENGNGDVSDSERWQRINAAVRERIGGEPIN